MNETPKFRLRDEIKELVRKNMHLRHTIMIKLEVSESTVYRWLTQDTPQTTDYNFLFVIWQYILENQELRQKFSHIKNIENLLTEKN